MRNLLPLCIIFVFAFSSCQQRMYFPDPVNAPGLRHAHDIAATVSVKLQNDEKDSFFHGSPVTPCVDAAYSPVEHVGIIASYHALANRVVTEEQNTLLYNHNVGGKFTGGNFDLGAGYYTVVNEEGLFEFYGGLGFGNIKRRGITNLSYDYDANYLRIFIQPSIGFTHKHFTLSGGIRCMLERFTEFNALNDPALRYTIANKDQLGTDVTAQNFVFIQPFMQMQIGYKYVWFNCQLGLSAQVSGGAIGDNPFYGSLGIALLSSDLFSKGKSKATE